MSYDLRCPTCGENVLHCDQCRRQIVRDEPHVSLNRYDLDSDPIGEFDSPDFCSVPCIHSWLDAHPGVLTDRVSKSWRHTPFEHRRDVGWVPVLPYAADQYARDLVQKYGLTKELAEQIVLDISTSEQSEQT